MVGIGRLGAVAYILVSLLFNLAGLAQEKVPVLKVAEIDKIRAAVGEKMTVIGTVERAAKSKGSGMNFLNFPGGEFSVVVFAKNLKNFPDGEPADVYDEKLVQVTGTIALYQDKPQIVLDTPAQITILNPETGKPFPEPAKAPEKPAPADVVKPTENPAPKEKPAAKNPAKVDPRQYFDDP